MCRGEGERGRTAAGVSDQMERVEAASIGLAQHPIDLYAEAVVRRRLVSGVHLEILRGRVHAVPEHLEQRRIGRFGRNDRTR